jgi:hypothetical protein
VSTSPYPDELYFGYAGRMRTELMALSTNAFNRSAFGTTAVHASSDFPARARAMATRASFSPSLSPDKLIWRHTFFPYYTAYLPRRERDRHLLKVLSGDLQGLHLRLGISSSTVKSVGKFRYCPSCWQLTMEQRGEVFARRLFQLPGVLVCPDHEEPLCSTDIKFRPVTTRAHHFFTPRDAQPRPVQLSDSDMQHAVALAQDSMRLLNLAREHAEELTASSHIYVHALRQLALASNNVRAAKFEKAFLDVFPMPFLERLGLGFTHNTPNHWLLRLVRRNTPRHHPLRHLLIQRFFSEQLGESWRQQITPQWPCPSPLAPHPGPIAVEPLQLRTKDDGAWTGTFECACGFRYSAQGHLPMSPYSFQLKKVIAHSPAMKAAALQRARNGATIHQIARELGLNRRTVQGLLESRVVDRRSLRKKYCATDRSAWLEHFAMNQTADVSRLRGSATALYNRLLRHDREWLAANRPAAQSRQCKSSESLWHGRDVEFCKRVAELTAELLSRRPPVRITISHIGRELGIRNILRRHLHQLPRTSALIANSVESIERFQLRRLTAVLSTQQVRRRRSCLMKAAGLNSESIRPAAAERLAEFLSESLI